MNVHGLRDVVDLRSHLAQLSRLKIQHLEEVVGQGVDLVGHGGQALGGVAEEENKRANL